MRVYSQSSLRIWVIMTLNDDFQPLNAAHSTLRESILALKPDQFLGSINGGWTPRDVVAHLVGWNHYMILACKDIMRGDPPSYYVEHSINYRDINAGFVMQYDSRDRDVMLGELGKSLGQLQTFVRGLSPDALDKDFGVTHYRGGVATITRTLQSLATDYEEHAAEIRSWGTAKG